MQDGGFAEALLVREGGVVAVGALADVRAALPASTMGVNADAASGVIEHDMGGSFLMPVRLPPARLAPLDPRNAT